MTQPTDIRRVPDSYHPFRVLDGCFTLRTYTHLMPSSEKRTREAVNEAFDNGPEDDDGPTTAQGA